MTRDEIIKLAREAGSQHQGELFVPDAFALRFAAVIEQRAAAAEREACAKVCDALAERSPFVESFPIAAAAIRARGEKP